MPHREYLFEIGSIGIAVQIDPWDAERLENRGQIVRRVCGAVQRRAIPKRLAAGGNQIHGPFLGSLQFVAIDDPRLTGAAIVHQQEVVPPQQWFEQGQVVVARQGGGVTGPTLGGDEGAQRFIRC